MKIKALLISILLAGILLAGCDGESKSDSVWYNGQWMSREEYTELKWQEELDAAQPAPADAEIIIPPVSID